jgi:hypothetical protein
MIDFVFSLRVFGAPASLPNINPSKKKITNNATSRMPKKKSFSRVRFGIVSAAYAVELKPNVVKSKQLKIVTIFFKRRHSFTNYSLFIYAAGQAGVTIGQRNSA